MLELIFFENPSPKFLLCVKNGTNPNFGTPRYKEKISRKGSFLSEIDK